MPPHRPHTAPAGSLTASQAAAILQVTPKTITRWAKEHRLPFMRTLGGHRRYDEAEIRKLLADHTIPVSQPPGTPGD